MELNVIWNLKIIYIKQSNEMHQKYSTTFFFFEKQNTQSL